MKEIGLSRVRKSTLAEILFVLNGTVMTTKLTMEPRFYYGLKGIVGA
jgi:hypothetical protein